MVIRELEYVIDTDIFDTAEGDCLFNDDVVTADMEAGYVDLMECIHYHNNVTCVKLGEIIEEQPGNTNFVNICKCQDNQEVQGKR